MPTISTALSSSSVSSPTDLSLPFAEHGTKLNDLLRTWNLFPGSCTYQELGVNSFLFDDNVRIRPSGRGKVLEKKELLINNSWNVVNPIVCRALPEFVEPAQNEQPARFMLKCYDKKHADFDRKIPVVNPFDGHHRLLAAAELEAEGIGPKSVGKENPVAGFYVVPCFVLKPDCPDHIARAIALALTQNELKTHANNTIGILHVVRKTQDDLKTRNLPFEASDVMQCLNAAAHVSA